MSISTGQHMHKISQRLKLLNISLIELDFDFKNLMNLIKNLEDKKKSSEIDIIIEKYLPIKTNRKAKSSKVESKRLQYLCENPKYLISRFKELGLTSSIISQAGGMGNHYDLVIKDTFDNIYTIEMKGFINYKKLDLCAPWTGGVTPQSYNGKGGDFILSVEYADYFYKNCLPNLASHYQVSSPIPSKPEWLKKDCFHIGNPLSSFGKELHEEIKKDNSFANHLWYTTHIDFVKSFLSDKEKKQGISDQIYSCLSKNLNDKDYWLNLQYPSTDSVIPLWIEGSWSLCKTPSITSFKVFELPAVTKTSAVIEFEYTTSASEKKYKGSARMRWRNRIGGNLGWNIL